MLSDVLYKLGNEIISAMRSSIDDFTGDLSNSLKYSVDYTPIGTELSITMLAYGQFLDTGTRGTDGCCGSRGGNTINRNFFISPELNQWATSKGLNVWGVAKNIQKYGTKPHPFIHHFEDIINANIDKISDAIGFDISDKVYKALLNSAK